MNANKNFSNEGAKKQAALRAADLIREKQIVGLGTGSTATYFIEALGARVKEGLRITAVATSQASADLATSLNIELSDLNDVSHIDITIDGADEVDTQKNLIKGGGGALLREKIVAASSHELIIIIDESKHVEHLGVFPLPVEVAPFGWKQTQKRLTSLGYPSTLRMDKTHDPYLTDNHHYILDIHLDHLLKEPLKDEQKIKSVPGVMETGLFIGMADRVIIGLEEGTQTV